MDFLSQFSTEILAFLVNLVTAYVAYRQGKKKVGG